MARPSACERFRLFTIWFARIRSFNLSSKSRHCRCRPILAGDYNGDGTVNAADFVLWRRTSGSTMELAADGNRNGIVDQDDYDIWRRNFGAIQFELDQSTVAVPEPYSAVSALLAASFVVGGGPATT